ncbi:hypothetical protein D3C72_1181700 [compost metagenome]
MTAKIFDFTRRSKSFSFTFLFEAVLFIADLWFNRNRNNLWLVILNCRDIHWNHSWNHRRHDHFFCFHHCCRRHRGFNRIDRFWLRNHHFFDRCCWRQSCPCRRCYCCCYSFSSWSSLWLRHTNKERELEYADIHFVAGRDSFIQDGLAVFESSRLRT